MDCCRVICWYRCACLSALTSRPVTKPKSVRERYVLRICAPEYDVTRTRSRFTWSKTSLTISLQMVYTGRRNRIDDRPLSRPMITKLTDACAIAVTIASQITSLSIVYSTIYSDTDERKYLSSASLAFVRGIYRGPVNCPHKWPVTQKMFPFDDVIMASAVPVNFRTIRWFNTQSRGFKTRLR